MYTHIYIERDRDTEKGIDREKVVERDRETDIKQKEEIKTERDKLLPQPVNCKARNLEIR